jgi:O-antigen/teichoic acid export membrane protein
MGAISSQGIKNFIITGGGALLGFISSGLLIPNVVSPEENGIIRLIAAIGVITGQVFTMGSLWALLKLHPKLIKRGTPLGKGLGYVMFIRPFVWFLPVFLLALWIGMPTLLRPFLHKDSAVYPFAWLLIPVTVFFGLFYIADSVARVHKLSVVGAVHREVTQRILFILAILLVVAGLWTTEQFIYAYAAALCAPGLLLLIYIKRKGLIAFKGNWKKDVPLPLRKEFNSLSMFGLLSGLTNFLVLSIDTLMVEKFLGTSATGVYAVMSYFGILVFLPARALERIATPILAQLYAENKLKEIGGVYANSCFFQTMASGLIGGMLWLHADLFLALLKPEYAVGKYALMILVLSNLTDAATGLNASVVGVSRYYKYNTYFIALLVLVSIVTNWIFIPIYGLTGAAVATLISIFFLNVLKFLFLWKKFGLQPFNGFYFILAGSLLLGVFLASHVKVPGIEHFLLIALFKSAVFGLVFGSAFLWRPIRTKALMLFMKIEK